MKDLEEGTEEAWVEIVPVMERPEERIGDEVNIKAVLTIWELED